MKEHDSQVIARAKCWQRNRSVGLRRRTLPARERSGLRTARRCGRSCDGARSRSITRHRVVCVEAHRAYLDMPEACFFGGIFEEPRHRGELLFAPIVEIGRMEPQVK